MEYKGGYKSEPGRSTRVLMERLEYEKYIETRDLIDLAGRIERGEPHEVNHNYGGQGYTYLYPETEDLGRIKVELIVAAGGGEKDKWKLEWEDVRG
jgi:hypothetical protein